MHFVNLDECLSLTSGARLCPSGLCYSVLPLRYLVCRTYALAPHLQRTSVPFSAWPQRCMRRCLKYWKWDTEPHIPNKGGERNNRIIGLNCWINILVFSEGFKSKNQSKPVQTPAIIPFSSSFCSYRTVYSLVSESQSSFSKLVCVRVQLRLRISCNRQPS